MWVISSNAQLLNPEGVLNVLSTMHLLHNMSHNMLQRKLQDKRAGRRAVQQCRGSKVRQVGNIE
jgi:hypothetical protein